jgi:hypothetical protein
VKSANKTREAIAMRILSIIVVGATFLVFSMQAGAQDKTKAKAGQKSSQDMGAIRNKCRAEVTGYGAGAQAQFRACVERAKSGAH